MNKSQLDRIKSVMSNGQIIALLHKPNNLCLTGRIYRTSESRGYKTDFTYKHFFYIVAFENDTPVNIEGITKDSRRKNILSHFEQHGIAYEITNNEAWQEWLK